MGKPQERCPSCRAPGWIQSQYPVGEATEFSSTGGTPVKVYVLDAWNDTSQKSVVAVFATRAKAQRELERVTKRPGVWYAGVVERTVR